MKKSATPKGESPSRLIDARDQGAARLEGQDAFPCPRSHQAG